MRFGFVLAFLLLPSIARCEVDVVAAGDRYPLPISDAVAESRAIRVGAVNEKGLPRLDGQEDPSLDIAAVAATTGEAAARVAEVLQSVSDLLPGLELDEARSLMRQTARPTLWRGIGALGARRALDRARQLSPGWPGNRAELRAAAVLTAELTDARETIRAIFARGGFTERLEAVRAAGSQGMVEILDAALAEGLRGMSSGLASVEARQLVTTAMASAHARVLDVSSFRELPEATALELLEAACLMGRLEYAHAIITRVRPDHIDIAPIAAQGLGDMVEWLLDHGARIEGFTNRLGTPLIAAATVRDGGATARLLLARGALPNRLSPTGESALTTAVARGNVEAIRHLIASHADPAIGRHHGSDALALARAAGEATVLAALGIAMPTTVASVR